MTCPKRQFRKFQCRFYKEKKRNHPWAREDNNSERIFEKRHPWGKDPIPAECCQQLVPTATPAQPPPQPSVLCVSCHAQLRQKLQAPAGQKGVVPLQPTCLGKFWLVSLLFVLFIWYSKTCWKMKEDGFFWRVYPHIHTDSWTGRKLFAYSIARIWKTYWPDPSQGRRL